MQRFYFVSLDTLQESVRAEVVIGNYEDENPFEFAIRWQEMGGIRPRPIHIVPVLYVFDDAWQFLYEHNQDVLQLMALHNDEEISVERFCSELERIGIPMLARIE